MASLALANALKDFGAQPTVSVEPLAAPLGFPMQEDVDLHSFAEFQPEEPVVDTEALVAEAVLQAETSLTARLAQEHEEAFETERARHAEEIVQIQTQLAEETSVRIQAGIENMEARLIELTSAVTARILGAVLTDDIRQRSIDKLADIIREALADDDAVRIRVRGSQPLYDALKASLPRYAEQMDFAESGNFDLTVTIDDSVFETRLAEWSAVLAEALS